VSGLGASDLAPNHTDEPGEPTAPLLVFYMNSRDNKQIGTELIGLDGSISGAATGRGPSLEEAKGSAI